MIKEWISGRQFLCLLVLALSLALLGCARSAEAASAAGAAEEKTGASQPALPGFFLTAEYDRLYFAPLDGSALRLVADNSTLCTARWGEWLYAAFEDGSIGRVRTDGSNFTVLVPAGTRNYRELIPFDGGVIGAHYSLREGAGYDLFREGSQTPVALFEGEPALMTCTVGQYIYSRRYDGVSGSRLVAFDPESLESLWEVPVDSTVELLRGEEGILCFVPNSGKLSRLDEDAQALVPVDTPLAKDDCELIAAYRGNYLVQGNWSDDYRHYLIQSASRRLLDESLPDFVSLMDLCEGKALLKYFEGGQSAAGENVWYRTDVYKVLDLESGEISDFPVHGQYGALFASGDFPLMDSSTARKPVTAELYAFFCESTGAGGKMPLCSTTHGAWLNIADGAADVALLAAPTQEEQDYLDERGVSVEMKLYGGDGLVFIGNRACGVEDMSLDQVRAIYRGEISNWSQLGGADRPIRVLYRDDQSGSQRLFERMLWKEEPVPDFEALGYDRLDEMSTIVSECLRDPYAIGYSIMTYLNDVYSSEDLLTFSLNGYAATPENVAARNYPLGTQGYVVIRSDEPADSPARRLFNFFGSPLSDVILTRNGVTPLSDDGEQASQ
ncbi:MAG: substrate-binding domain-containing protein [Oscillospiraceae bacterium]|nr:substrate-binding domain-containing protein [Oscillospiraceae bacterium]